MSTNAPFSVYFSEGLREGGREGSSQHVTHLSNLETGDVRKNETRKPCASRANVEVGQTCDRRVFKFGHLAF